MSDNREFLVWDLKKDKKKISSFFESNVKDSGVVLGDTLSGLKLVPDNTFQTCVTSPPYYFLRDYQNPEQIGLEDTVYQYIDKLADVFDEVKRTLKKDGTLWLNIGDTYAGSGGTGERPPDKLNPDKGLKKMPKTPEGKKPKDLIGVPWLLAFELQKRGWWLRQEIIWDKNGQPESVVDRPTRSHEQIFLLSKNSKYFYDIKGIRTSGDGNLRSVWKVNMERLAEEHIAAYPKGLVNPCLQLSTRKGDIVVDPFSGSGTTGIAALQMDRRYFGCELNPSYIEINKRRVNNETRTGATLLQYLSKK